MAFITDAVLRTALTASNTQATDALPNHWDAIIPRAVIRGYLLVRAVFLGRGYSAAQFASWGNGSSTDGYDWNLRVSVVCAFIEAARSDEDRGAAYREELKELLEELKTALIVIDGVLVTSGRISYGDYVTTDDIHTIEDEL